MAREHRRHARSLVSQARLALSITPMIDVVFLLLVYFLLTSGLGHGERLLRLRGGTVGAGLRRRSARGLAIDPASRPRPRPERLAGIPAYAVHLGPDAFRPGAVDPLLELLA